jgi:hypothetical protein
MTKAKLFKETYNPQTGAGEDAKFVNPAQIVWFGPKPKNVDYPKAKRASHVVHLSDGSSFLCKEDDLKDLMA